MVTSRYQHAILNFSGPTVSITKIASEARAHFLTGNRNRSLLERISSNSSLYPKGLNA